MADSSSHKLDLRVGGKYRLGKKIGSGSFGACILFSRHPPRSSSLQQVTSTLESTSSLARKSPSSLSLSRLNTPSSSMNRRSTRRSPAVSVFLSLGGSVQNAITTQWFSTSSAHLSKTSSISATASSALRRSYSLLINWYVNVLFHLSYLIQLLDITHRIHPLAQLYSSRHQT